MARLALQTAHVSLRRLPDGLINKMNSRELMSQDKPVNRQHMDHHEAGVEVPYERINPETLRNMIQEFVTRDGADWGDDGCSLEDKYQQVLQQLKTGRVKVVFDLTAQTGNIVACR
jgi:uncharacterized protein YheU (UPF0270 family)